MPLVGHNGKSKPRLSKDTEDIQRLIVLWETVIKPEIEADVESFKKDTLSLPVTAYDVAKGVLQMVEARIIANIVIETVPKSRQPAKKKPIVVVSRE